MLWTIAVVLIALWLSGLATGYTMGSFIHVLFAAAVALLVVSLSQEAMINRKLRNVLYNGVQKPDSRQRHRRVTDPVAPLRVRPWDRYPDGTVSLCGSEPFRDGNQCSDFHPVGDGHSERDVVSRAGKI